MARLYLLLPESQRLLMKAVLDAGKPTIICLMAGSAIDLQEGAERADAVLLPWYPGARGGRAVADILFGKASPSGKLPVTFYHNEQLRQMPEFTDYAMQGRTYRYFDGVPQYPFGYGLTYGDAHVLSATAEKQADGVDVTMEIVNDGRMDTQEVAQVYVQNEGSAFAPRNPRLCGFARVNCPAGEKTTVRVHVRADALLVVNDEGEKVADGAIALYAGMGQPDARTQALTGHAAVRVALGK